MLRNTYKDQVDYLQTCEHENITLTKQYNCPKFQFDPQGYPNNYKVKTFIKEKLKESEHFRKWEFHINHTDRTKYRQKMKKGKTHVGK